MKKFAIILLAIAMLMLAGCKCKHEWQDADCLNPKTCSKCGETEGEALGHGWKKATCTAPKTCKNCGETEGEALDHDWEDATCTDPKTCSNCGKTKGEALGHQWTEATCTTAKTCSLCNATEGDALGHTWQDATYGAPKTCSVCGETEGEALVRVDLGKSTDEMVTILDTTMQLTGYKLTYWGLDEDGWPTYDLVESSTGNYTNVYVSFAPNGDGTKVVSVFIVAEDVTDNTAVTLMGVVAGASLVAVEPKFDVYKITQAFSSEPIIQDNVAYYFVEDKGVTGEMQVDSEYAVFWVYPSEE